MIKVRLVFGVSVKIHFFVPCGHALNVTEVIVHVLPLRMQQKLGSVVTTADTETVVESN